MAVASTLSTEPQYAKVEHKKSQPTARPSKLSNLYHVEEIIAHIKANNYLKPCLQFPDNLVRDSSQVAATIQLAIGRPVYVLADTSYSPCCIDEIAAQHVKGDVVFHFGNACLNPTRILPAVYVNPKQLNCDEDKILQFINGIGKAILYPDTNYTQLGLRLASSCSNNSLVLAVLHSTTADFIPSLDPLIAGSSFQVPQIQNRKLTKAVENLDGYRLVYLTDDPSESLLLHWSTTFDQIDVVNGLGSPLNFNVALKRRYRYVQIVKAAATIGILVNTLSLKETASLLVRIKKAITDAEKKYYMFVVGKPNVAKLGNFEAIDVWVILGCPQGGIIVNSDEYFKPIVTPYELELAFTDRWTGKWLLAFDQVLPNERTPKESPSSSSGKEPADKEPLFDLVTGKFVFNNAPLRQVSHLSLDDGEIRLSSDALAIRNTVSTAAEKLQQRSWKGLGSDHGDINTEYAKLKKGRSGIARNYHEQQ